MEFRIETFDLTKKFRLPKKAQEFFLHPFLKREITAIKGVTLQVKKGEVFGILGPNGAGKTTLIKTLSTLILPTSGYASVNGYDIVKDSAQIKKSIGYVMSDERSFFWRLSGRQNLSFFATLYDLPKEEAKKRIDELLQLLGLEGQADHKFMNYSTGMRQKLAVARGLLTDPTLIFMDEPTKSLDPQSSQSLYHFIKERIIGEGDKTVFLATHNLAEAEYLCDRLAIINEGKVIACGRLKEIKSLLSPNERYLLILKGLYPWLPKRLLDLERKIISIFPLRNEGAEGDSTFEILLNERDTITEILSLLVGLGVKVKACYPQEVSLREVLNQFLSKKLIFPSPQAK